MQLWNRLLVLVTGLFAIGIGVPACEIKTQIPERKWKTVIFVLLLVSVNLSRIISCSPRRLQNRILNFDKKSTFCHTSHSKRETRFLQSQKRSLRLGQVLDILDNLATSPQNQTKIHVWLQLKTQHDLSTVIDYEVHIPHFPDRAIFHKNHAF